MKIAHLSMTPLAAAPIRICNALNMLDGVDARLIQYNEEGHGRHSFETDLIWGRHTEEAKKIIADADILHLHNYINLNTNEFESIDFKSLWDSKKPMLRHFHSTPFLISKMTHENVQDVINCEIPQLVISQYPERFYNMARIVPNIVFDLVECGGFKRATNLIRVGYSPSNFRAARSTRWDTKGYPETIRVLKQFIKKAKRRGLHVELDIIEQVTHDECLRRKMNCDIAIDDVSTGSYHMSTLESLILGSAVLTFMDDRILKTVKNICGRDDFPVINTRLEDLESMLLYLAERPELTRQIGQDSGNWMKKYWRPENMAMKFVDIYNEVIENPHTSFPERFSLQAQSDCFLNQEVYDVLWKARHERWPKDMPLVFKKIKSNAGRALRKVGLKK